MEKKRKRRKFSPEQKKEIVLMCLRNPGRVSEICRKYKVHPTLYYRWRKQFVEGGTRYLEANTKNPEKFHQKELAELKEAAGNLYLENAFLKKLLESGK